jgi:hypothetical protein
MSVVYTNTLKDNRMTQVINAVGNAGKLVIMTAADATLVTITLGSPFGTTSNGTLTLGGTPLSASASGTGTAAKAKITTSADAGVITGLTVSTSGADINLSTISINSGNTVTITSANIVHA